MDEEEVEEEVGNINLDQIRGNEVGGNDRIGRVGFLINHEGSKNLNYGLFELHGSDYRFPSSDERCRGLNYLNHDVPVLEDLLNSPFR